ncbi:MAG TPA: hypothetical protein EYP29_04240 [Thermoplasmata archaeon]|nr:hypothetical protein [Thermoplasmata archaeon]
MPLNLDQLICFSIVGILLFMGILHVYAKRKDIIYFLKHRRFRSELQKRICPGCNSDDLVLLSNKSVKCNSCGTIFASTRSLKEKEE